MSARVLAVDDFPDSLRMLRTLLSQHLPDVAFLEATNGRHAIRQAREERPDLILLDVKLPDMDGFEVCRRLKSDSELGRIPILMISGEFTDPAHRASGMLNGAEGYLCKPFATAEFVAQVRSLFRIKAYEDQLLKHRQELENVLAARTRQLRASEEKYRKLVETSNDAIIVAEAESGRIVECNRKAEALLALPAERIIGLHQSEIHPPEEAARCRVLFRRYIERGGGLRETLYVRRSDGESVPVEINANLLIIDGKQYVQGVFRDASERFHAEQALREAHDRLETILNTVPVAILAVDAQGRVLMWNPAAERTFGWSFHEVQGRPLPIIPEAERDSFAQRLKATLKGQRMEGLEVKRQRRDGTFIDINLWTAPLKNRHGELIGTLGVLVDVTERIRAREAVLESQRTLETLMSNLSGMVYRCRYDGNWTMLFLSDGCRALTGYAPGDLIHNQRVSYAELIHPEDAVGVRATIRRAVETDSAFKHEYRIRTSGGNEKWVWEQGRGVGKGDDGTRILEGLIVDISERKNMEAALVESRARMRDLTTKMQSALEEERTRIAREIHDQLGQALSGLRMDLATLESSLAQISLHPVSEEIRTRLTAMDTLIEQTIGDVRRISAELRPGVLDDLGLFAALQWQAREFEQRSGIECTATTSGSDESLDEDVSTQVFRVFQEALLNIARHAKATRIQVQALIEDDILFLEIRDNGKGITPQQVSARNSLGLMGMRERIHFVHGSISWNGRPDEGTTVQVEVPLASDGPPPPDSRPRSE